MKNKIILWTVIFFAFVCGFLVNAAKPANARPLRFNYGRFTKISNGEPCDVYKDKKTGIEYVVVDDEDGMGISVIYNKDGKPRMAEEDE